jgi:hypothetical protein
MYMFGGLRAYDSGGAGYKFNDLSVTQAPTQPRSGSAWHESLMMLVYLFVLF